MTISLSYLIVCSVVAYLAGMFSPFRRPTDRVTKDTEDEAEKLFAESLKRIGEKKRCGGPCKPGGCGRGCSIPPNSPHVPPRQ